MTIKGYSYSPRWGGTIVDENGRAICDKNSHIGGDEWAKLQRAAFHYFYETLKGNQSADPLPPLPEGMQVVISDEIAEIRISTEGDITKIEYI